jgi:hypothetical protein
MGPPLPPASRLRGESGTTTTTITKNDHEDEDEDEDEAIVTVQ